MRINLGSYHTVYKCKVNDDVIFADYEACACFSRLYNRVSNDYNTFDKVNIELSIKVCIDMYEVDNRSHNNICFLNGEEFKYFVSELAKIFDIEYNYSKENDHYLYFNMKGSLNTIEIKLFTTLFRYCYEYPYCIFLKEAVILKQAKKFININLFNAYNIVCVSYTNVYVGMGHGCVDNNRLVALLNYKNIKKQMQIVSSCNNVYKRLDVLPRFKVSMPIDIPNDYFELVKVFQRYKKTYYQNYILLKQQENYIQNV